MIPWRRAVVAGLVFALAGFASAQAAKPAVCDGKHRRAVNIHGSVLGDVPPAAATAGQSDRTRKSPTAANAAQSSPAKVSQAGPGPLWFPSC